MAAALLSLLPVALILLAGSAGAVPPYGPYEGQSCPNGFFIVPPYKTIGFTCVPDPCIGNPCGPGEYLVLLRYSPLNLSWF